MGARAKGLLQWAIRRELLWQWENDIADVEDLDMAIFFGPGVRWATQGFLTAIDMGGLDIACATGTNLLKDMDDSKTVVPKMLALRDAGHLGLKTGKGFFEYAEEDRKNIKDAYVRRLVRQLSTMHDHLKTMKVQEKK